MQIREGVGVTKVEHERGKESQDDGTGYTEPYGRSCRTHSQRNADRHGFRHQLCQQSILPRLIKCVSLKVEACIEEVLRGMKAIKVDEV